MSIDLEYAIKKDIRNNLVVREIDRAQKRELLRTIAVFSAIVGMLLFAAWQHSRVVRTGYDVETLRREVAEAQEMTRQYRLQLDTDARPQRIEERAMRELNMVRPGEQHTMVLERTRAASPRGNIIARAR
jgi:cell division protein FtsB